MYKLQTFVIDFYTRVISGLNSKKSLYINRPKIILDYVDQSDATGLKNILTDVGS